MPIHTSIDLSSVDDDQFAEIDHEVMGCAYASQNEFGRLFDEHVYENDVAIRLRDKGFRVHTQVPVSVSHGCFEKTYIIDLIVNQMLYELKVADKLSGRHEAQCILYAILQNIRLAKLINFGESKVQGKLLVNALAKSDRYQPTFCGSDMRLLTPQCEHLVDVFRELIQDWGTHLSSELYNEALVHQLGGKANCVKRIELRSRMNLLGTHCVQFYATNHGFVVTTLTGNQTAYQQHLRSLLSHTDLYAIQWINLNHSRVEISTLAKE